MAESVNLQKCTKEELLFLIDRMRHYNVGDNLFRFARRDLVNERLMRREWLAQEQALLDKAIAADKKWARLMDLNSKECGV